MILYYIGPSTVNRLLGRTPVQDLEAGALCVQTKLAKFSTLINQYNAHKTFQVFIFFNAYKPLFTVEIISTILSNFTIIV